MFRPTSSFDKLLEKATSNLKLEPDWPVIMQICDLIRQGDVQSKYALGAIKKKMMNSNPHVAMFALNVLESCVKNCGSLIHDEIGTKAYMEQLRELIKGTSHDNVKTKLLELLQAWAYAFRNSPKYRAVQDTVNIMKAEGYKFPALKESDAMFSADTAPEWADGDCCHRCRVQFSILQRKHHCRACGQVFCGQCTAKTCTLPKFGFEKEVRVCEACFEKVNKPSAAGTKTDDLPIEYLTSSLAQQSQAPPPRKSEAELKEEEELQLAIALSQSEAEHKNKISTNRIATTATRTKSYSPPAKLSTSPEADPELARYLNRSYWQQQSSEYSNASAPVMSATSTPPKQSSVPEQNGVEESEMEEFVSALQSQVEIFVNRMKSNSSRGRSIANDSSVQTLFMNITAMHSKLLRYIQQQDDKRVYYEGLQDKLAQVKDARAALDALREEHREKLRREAEIAERQRQLQMAQKLDIMRKKKQEYLQYQRQLALQRIQEQEREMQIRQEQQKQQYLMGSQYATLPYMRPGYDMTGRFPNHGPPPHSAPPFAHFPAPPATSVHLDGPMGPHPGGPMIMGQPGQPLPMDQQGMMIRSQPNMMPQGGMVPSQNMMPLGPQGSLPPHMQMMGQRAPGQGLPGALPNIALPHTLPSSLPLSGSQTLPRPSTVQGPPLGPPQNVRPQGLPGAPQGQQPSLGGPQSLPPMGGPQPMVGQQAPMGGQQAPMGGQQPPMGISQSIPGAPQHQAQSAMNGPQPTLSGPQSAPGIVGPGIGLGSQVPLSTMPQALPPHLTAQGMGPMMTQSGQPSFQPPMTTPQPLPQPQPQSQTQAQPQQEDKTAELISFD